MSTPLPHKESQDYSFPEDAVEVMILDRRGQTLWTGQRKGVQRLVWSGHDTYGARVPVGTYTCKMTFADRKVIYVPFVLMK
jgi:flagellar hook assembly protein FlgD